MPNKTMGEIISSLRKEKSLTQKALADMLNVTDKAVSKWERDVSCPDTQLIPKLAEILDISVEELMNCKPKATQEHKGGEYMLNIILRAVPVAMGIAVFTTSLLGSLDIYHGLSMLGLGLSCMGIYMLKNN